MKLNLNFENGKKKKIGIFRVAARENVALKISKCIEHADRGGENSKCET